MGISEPGSIRSGMFRVEGMATTVLIASISLPLLTELFWTGASADPTSDTG